MITADLDAADLDWNEHNISGSEKPARMVMLHARRRAQHPHGAWSSSRRAGSATRSATSPPARRW